MHRLLEPLESVWAQGWELEVWGDYGGLGFIFRSCGWGGGLSPEHDLVKGLLLGEPRALREPAGLGVSPAGARWRRWPVA